MLGAAAPTSLWVGEKASSTVTHTLSHRLGCSEARPSHRRVCVHTDVCTWPAPLPRQQRGPFARLRTLRSPTSKAFGGQDTCEH